MRYIFTILALLIGILIILPGCISTTSQTRIDDLTKKLTDLQTQVEEKMAKARTGELSIGEALEFVRYTEGELKDTRDELKDIKEKESVGWAEIIGTLIASMLGTTGVIRAWRGPTHKTTLSSTP